MMGKFRILPFAVQKVIVDLINIEYEVYKQDEKEIQQKVAFYKNELIDQEKWGCISFTDWKRNSKNKQKWRKKHEEK